MSPHPTRRFLFTVEVKSASKLFYSVAAPDEATATESLKAGDQNCMLIYEDTEVLRNEPASTPVCIGLDPQFRRHRNV